MWERGLEGGGNRHMSLQVPSEPSAGVGWHTILASRLQFRGTCLRGLLL